MRVLTMTVVAALSIGSVQAQEAEEGTLLDSVASQAAGEMEGVASEPVASDPVASDGPPELILDEGVLSDSIASEPVMEDAEAAPMNADSADGDSMDTEVAPEEGLPAEATHGLYEEIGSAGDWTAIKFEPVADRTVCAIFSRPTDSLIVENGNAVAALRGERAAFITWESGVVSDEGGVFSAILGAPLDNQFEGHTVATDTETFTLFGHDDRLYVDEADDAAAIAAIRGGLTLTLTATLPGGREAQDTYSLRGVQASTELAKGACPAP